MSELTDAKKLLEKLNEEQLSRLKCICQAFLSRGSQNIETKNIEDIDIATLVQLSDGIRDQLTPITLRAKTILKQIKRGNVSNKHIAKLVGGILTSSEKIILTTETIREITTTPEPIIIPPMVLCTCNVIDLWNGKKCCCEAAEQPTAAEDNKKNGTTK